jgi:hypothetical protein
MLLAFESSDVVALRMLKVLAGGSDAIHEAREGKCGVRSCSKSDGRCFR